MPYAVVRKVEELENSWELERRGEPDSRSSVPSGPPTVSERPSLRPHLHGFGYSVVPFSDICWKRAVTWCSRATAADFRVAGAASESATRLCAQGGEFLTATHRKLYT